MGSLPVRMREECGSEKLGPPSLPGGDGAGRSNGDFMGMDSGSEVGPRGLVEGGGAGSLRTENTDKWFPAEKPCDKFTAGSQVKEMGLVTDLRGEDGRSPGLFSS